MVDFDDLYGLGGSRFGDAGSGVSLGGVSPSGTALAAIDDDKDEDEAYFEGDDELDDDEDEFDDFDEFDDDEDDASDGDDDDDEDEEL